MGWSYKMAMFGLKLYTIDIGDFLKEEIKGPASFSCTTGSGCKFQEPSMNQLINDVFGDGFISLICEGGECLYYTQVPGYKVNMFRIICCAFSNTFLFFLSAHRSQTVQFGWL